MAMPKWFAPALAITTAVMVFSGLRAAKGSAGPETVTVVPEKNYKYHAIANNVLPGDAIKLQGALVAAGITNATVTVGPNNTADIEYQGSPAMPITYSIGEKYTLGNIEVTMVSIEET